MALTATLKLPTIVQELALNTIRFNRNLQFAQNRLNRFLQGAADFGIGLSLAVSIPLQLMVGAAIKSFLDLEHAATRAESRVAGGGRGLRLLLMEHAKLLSLKFPLSPVEITEGMEEMIKAGFSMKESMAAIRTAMEFAAAGPVDLKTSVEGLAGVMTAFRLRTGDFVKDMETMRHVSDVITHAHQATIADAGEILSAFARQGAIAGQLAGLSFEETTAAIMSLHQAMIRGSAAGTALMQSLRDIGQTSLKNRAIWLREGIFPFDAQGQMLSMADIVGQLEQRMQGMSRETARTFLLMLKLPSRSLNATLALLGLSQQTAAFEQQLRNVGGLTQQVAETQMSSLQTEITLLQNRFTVMKTELASGFTPALKELVRLAEVLVFWFINLTAQQKQTLTHWTLLAIIAPIVLLVISPILRVVAWLIITFLGWTIALAGVILRLGWLILRTFIFNRAAWAMYWRVVQLTAVILAYSWNIARLAARYIFATAVSLSFWVTQNIWISLAIGAIAVFISFMHLLITGQWGFTALAEAGGKAWDWIIGKATAGANQIGAIMTNMMDDGADLAKDVLGPEWEKIQRELANFDMPGLLKGLSGEMPATLLEREKTLEALLSSVGPAGELGPGAERLLADAVERGILSAEQERVLRGGLQGFDVSDFTPPTLIAGEKKEEFDFGKEKKARAIQLRGFEAREFGEEEGFRARIRGQEAMRTLANVELNVQKSIDNKMTKNNSLLEGIETQLAGLGSLGEVGV